MSSLSNNQITRVHQRGKLTLGYLIKQHLTSTISQTHISMKSQQNVLNLEQINAFSLQYTQNMLPITIKRSETIEFTSEASLTSNQGSIKDEVVFKSQKCLFNLEKGCLKVYYAGSQNLNTSNQQDMDL
jgi:hypothetical protein